MSSNSLGTLGTLVTTFAIATAPVTQNRDMKSSNYPMQPFVSYEQLLQSGDSLINFPHASDVYFRNYYVDKKIDVATMEMQKRYQLICHSFRRYNDGFPAEKQSYFAQMADILCRLDFNDNISSFNKIDASIDSVLKLKNGLTLSVSCFIEDEIDTPMVFSIHRGRVLLVSDELPLSEIVNTINTVRV